MGKAEIVVKWGVVAIAALIAAALVWSSAKPDQETQEFLDKKEAIQSR